MTRGYGHVLPPKGKSIEQSFWEFHKANPHVYQRLVAMARQLRSRGYRRIGIGMLFEVLRWEHMTKTRRPGSDFKLNNNYRSYYARLIMTNHVDLAGIFETRRLNAVDPFAITLTPTGEVEVVPE